MSTPLPALPLIDALLTMARAAVGAGATIYLGGAPREATPVKYAVFYPDSGMRSASHRNLANDGPDELRYQVTSVGAGPEQALWVADTISGALLTGIPTVAGRRVWKTVEESAQPLKRDDTSTGLWFVTAQYLTRSDLP